jgi:hypothetical protein
MGGNLFKLGRLPKAQYLEIEQEIRSYLQQKIGAENFHIPRYYADKPDFGDMDIIVSLAEIGQNWGKIKKDLINDLGISQFKSNGAVFSTVYKNFQVDYFTAEAEYFEAKYNYLSFNDLSNLIGKIYHRFGLKYGENGLLYVFRRDDTHYKKEIKISTDFRKICAFLHLDYASWEVGFKNLPQMFDWVIKSPFFSVKPYQEELSGGMEKREERRTTVQKFINYLAENQIVKSYHYLENKAEYLPMIHSFFPEADLLNKISEEENLEKIASQIQKKFNGNLIMEWIPGLSGKELGRFILDFKSQFIDFEDFILKSSLVEIKERVIKFNN